LLQFSDGESVYALVAGQSLDLSKEFDDTAVLKMQVKVNEITEATVNLSMSCGVYCTGSLNIAAQLKALSLNEWTTLEVGLSCFADAGAKLSRIDMPFVLQSSGKLEMAFSELAITNSESSVTCP
jgi:beta-glucosidase